jgi:hypothetical protein
VLDSVIGVFLTQVGSREVTQAYSIPGCRTSACTFCVNRLATSVTPVYPVFYMAHAEHSRLHAASCHERHAAVIEPPDSLHVCKCLTRCPPIPVCVHRT